MGDLDVNGIAALARLPVIVQGIAWAQVLSVATLFGIMRLVAGRRVGSRYIMGASILGSFALWPNLVAVYSTFADPETQPSFFGILDTDSPGIYVFELVMSDILVVVLLNQYAIFAAILVVPAVLLAGASSVRHRQIGYGIFLAVLPASWVLALLNQAPW